MTDVLPLSRPQGSGASSQLEFVFWGGGFPCGRRVSERAALCVDWLVPGARPGEIASLSTVINQSCNPAPLLLLRPFPDPQPRHSRWGRRNTRTPPLPPAPPPPRDDACVWRLIGGRVSALSPSPPAAIFFLPCARCGVLRAEEGLTVELVTVYEYEYEYAV